MTKIKGKVILNHVRASSQYPEAITFNVARKPIKDMTQLLSLAPSWDLINNWLKRKITWEEYVEAYNKELDSRFKTVNKVLWSIDYFLQLGYDVQFICFCSNPKYCHRSILGEYYENRGYKVIGKSREEKKEK